MSSVPRSPCPTFSADIKVYRPSSHFTHTLYSSVVRPKVPPPCTPGPSSLVASPLGVCLSLRASLVAGVWRPKALYDQRPETRVITSGHRGRGGRGGGEGGRREGGEGEGIVSRETA